MAELAMRCSTDEQLVDKLACGDEPTSGLKSSSMSRSSGLRPARSITAPSRSPALATTPSSSSKNAVHDQAHRAARRPRGCGPGRRLGPPAGGMLREGAPHSAAHHGPPAERRRVTKTPIAKNTLTTELRGLYHGAQAAGVVEDSFDPRRVSAISLRRGGNTAATAAGCSAILRAAAGRWRSVDTPDQSYVFLHETEMVGMATTMLQPRL